MERECVLCGRKLAPDNQDKLCSSCARRLKDVLVDLPETLDVEDMRKLLHLQDEETVRRKHRKGELPPCIPGQKKLLWLKSHIMAYLEGGQPMYTPTEIEQAILIGLQKGVPIQEATFNGWCPENLIEILKATGDFPPRPSQK